MLVQHRGLGFSDVGQLMGKAGDLHLADQLVLLQLKQGNHYFVWSSFRWTSSWREPIGVVRGTSDKTQWVQARERVGLTLARTHYVGDHIPSSHLILGLYTPCFSFWEVQRQIEAQRQ